MRVTEINIRNRAAILERGFPDLVSAWARSVELSRKLGVSVWPCQSNGLPFKLEPEPVMVGGRVVEQLLFQL